MGMLRDIWNYRGFILGSVKREFQLKYRNSLFGAAWTILNPLAMILIYTVIFSSVMHSRLPGETSAYSYSIYLCSGILTWGLFSEIIGRSQIIFLENAHFLKKVNFPRVCLPVIIVLTAIINFLIIFSLFLVFLIFSGNFPGIVCLALIPLLILQIWFSISIGLITGILNVFFRDVGQFMGVALQFWFWLTPIVYLRSLLSESAISYLRLNPLANLMDSYQNILVRGAWPQWPSLIPLLILTIILSMVAIRLYRMHAHEMVDEL